MVVESFLNATNFIMALAENPFTPKAAVGLKTRRECRNGPKWQSGSLAGLVR